MSDAIQVELTATNFLTRQPCDVCGGHTEKVPILAEVTEGHYCGFRVCERCIRERDFDERLREQAGQLETRAAELRALIGRLRVPTQEDYEQSLLRYEVAGFASWCEGSTAPQGDWDPACERIFNGVLTDDQEFAKWHAEYVDYQKQKHQERAGDKSPLVDTPF